MRLITLNVWGGGALHPLMNFFRDRADETDIFCLQEVFDTDQAELDKRHPDTHLRADLFKIIKSSLKDFDGFFAAFDDVPTRMSQAIFIRRSLVSAGSAKVGDLLVYEPEQKIEFGRKIFSPRKLQHAVMTVNGKELVIVNYHGLWNAGPKTDTPDRIAQSKAIKDFLKKHSGPRIVCGDFNLLPHTESVQILEEGMVNLVKDYKTESTRTVLYRHYDNPEEPNFADYIFVSPDIKVKNFRVLPDVVSDHSPLVVDFDL